MGFKEGLHIIRRLLPEFQEDCEGEGESSFTEIAQSGVLPALRHDVLMLAKVERAVGTEDTKAQIHRHQISRVFVQLFSTRRFMPQMRQSVMRKLVNQDGC